MEITALPAFADNLIWLARADATVIVVDPGDAAPVLQALSAPPDAIFVTHHHDDHCGGVPALQAQWPGVAVMACDDPRIAFPCHRLADGEHVAVGSLRFTAWHVPGHTRSHVALHGHEALFCGDTLFSLGCGRLFEGTPAQMHASLRRLAGLPAATRVCCGHEYTLANAAFACTVEPDNRALQARTEQAKALRARGACTLPSRLDDERTCNPFLRCDVPAVRAAVAAHCGTPIDADDDAIFAGLRAWKDTFTA